MSELAKRWRKESLELIEKATPKDKDKRCVVVFQVDSVGVITATAYAPRGIALAELCYNDDTSKRPGAYGLRLNFPDLDRVITAYSQASNIPSDKVRTDDPNFISWMTTLMEQQTLGNETHASLAGGFFPTYGTKTHALKALWSGDVFAYDPNKNKEAEGDFLP